MTHFLRSFACHACASLLAPLLLAPLFLLAGVPSRAYPGEPVKSPPGYYRFPAIHGNTVIFTSEGDLWQVPLTGGTARRLTSHPGEERDAAISPDGTLVAFTAVYEGPREVYVMPLGGGLPVRCTFGAGARVAGWTPDGRVLYSTNRHSTLPDTRLRTVHPNTRKQGQIPLAQAADGCFSPDGKTLFFTRLPFQGSHAKRYKGGTVQNLWRFTEGEKEAVRLIPDFAGTSKSPIWWEGRVYFASDRDGIMNVWSMSPEGRDLKQHTHYTDFDIQSLSIPSGNAVYQHGADIRLLNLASGKESLIPIRLASDFDQTRERWVKDPVNWVTSSSISPDGKRIALTARGQIFLAPVKQGRLIEVTRKPGVRYRDARFLPDGKSLVALSDESGEVELWKLPAGGGGDTPSEQLTRDGEVLRWGMVPSPDGKWIAHTDKNQRLWLYSVEEKKNNRIAVSEEENFYSVVWSPDSRYLVYREQNANRFGQLKLYSMVTGKVTALTTDRYESYSPAFSQDGKFLYFLSDRRFVSSVGSPWGQRQPEPYFDRQTQIYFVSLRSGLRSPFQPDNELIGEQPEEKKPEDKDKKPEVKPLEIEETGLIERLGRVPVPAGNYDQLGISGKRLFFLSSESGSPQKLVTVEIKNDDPKIETVLENVSTYELTPDGKKVLARVGGDFVVFDANGSRPNLNESKINLGNWLFSLDPREEWRQMFDEAWRLHRDYIYDPKMHRVDWPAMRRKYRPLAERVSDRAELSDAIAQMVGELSLLHTSVVGGDLRSGNDRIGPACLGAEWEREEAAGGYRVTRLYRGDPDEPEQIGPLLQPGVDVREGDIVERINGVLTLSVPDAEALLRAQAEKQVRLRILPGGDKAKARDVVVEPLTPGRDYDLRYDDWEYSRRQIVEKEGEGQIGYVHLRAMGSEDISQWQRDFYPVFNRAGLILDVRHNQGGNIDSWILEKLLRKAWMYWKPRVGNPYWNMQYAFRGVVVVLCDEWTGSDGEAVTDGFRRLGLGKVIGTRTWGGEVWLTGSNILVDRGIATAAEFGVYGPEGAWLIEGHGVDPDMVVDNLPHATYKGEDAQLAAALKYLREEIKKRPNPVPPVPPYPDKSFSPRERKP